MLHLSTQHHLRILQGLVVQQPVQLCPLCGGVAVLVLNGDAVDGKSGVILKSGFYSVGVHIEAAGKQFVHALNVTMAQRLELDYLVYNDPLGYADLILNGDPEEYLRNVVGSHGLED